MTLSANIPPLILASSSRYRRELLERLQLPFTVQAPEIDESPLSGETPADLASRLARQKAGAIAKNTPEAIVIGSDQVVECEGRSLGKPGTAARAEEQLLLLQGRTVCFHTAVTVKQDSIEYSERVPTTVQMRRLTRQQVCRYVAAESPLDCAGAFKSEALGISLIKRLSSDDPTALVGLPLIATVRLLSRFGILLP